MIKISIECKDVEQAKAYLSIIANYNPAALDKLIEAANNIDVVIRNQRFFDCVRLQSESLKSDLIDASEQLHQAFTDFKRAEKEAE